MKSNGSVVPMYLAGWRFDAHIFPVSCCFRRLSFQSKTDLWKAFHQHHRLSAYIADDIALIDFLLNAYLSAVNPGIAGNALGLPLTPILRCREKRGPCAVWPRGWTTRPSSSSAPSSPSSPCCCGTVAPVTCRCASYPALPPSPPAPMREMLA